MNFFSLFIVIWNLVIQKGKWQTKKKIDIEAWLISYPTFIFWEETQQIDG